MNHQITFTTSGPVMNRYDVSWKVDGGIFNIVRQIFDIWNIKQISLWSVNWEPERVPPSRKKISVVQKTTIFYNCKKR